MNNHILSLTVIFAFLAAVTAECPNACSAHGKCGAFDMCQCYRNWMSNDCSERICQFNLAHVDTPLGDLDASSGKLGGPTQTVVKNSFMYPHGTSEQYPNMVDSNNQVLDNSAHAYAECSNKGICDRSTGTCNCFEGYEGSACQRASCPTNSNGVCSGHGTCETIKHIADLDYKNVYNLWDEHATMGCVCDAGFGGPDCSQKQCKVGADPLYYDDFANVRYANTTVTIYTKNRYQGTSSSPSWNSTNVYGNFSIIFYDAFGEDWVTEPLPYNADCTQIIRALENLPNNVVPQNTTRCQNYFYSFSHPGNTPENQGSVDTATAFYDNDAYSTFSKLNGDGDIFAIHDYDLSSTTASPYLVHNKFTLAFAGNPGKLRQIEITKYLDGTRPTMYTDEEQSSLGWWIYSNGYTGENADFVPDLCAGVLVTLDTETPNANINPILGFTDPTMKNILKKCLGDSNGDLNDNVDVYNWDYGTQYNPHLIKLIDATQDFVAEFDPSTRDVPVSQLCTHYWDYAPHWGTTDTSNPPRDNNGVNAFDGFSVNGHTGFGDGWCHNLNPPGFYAVIWWDDLSQKFRAFTRAHVDYSSNTPFHVFTTTGYLQLVNPFTAASNSPIDYSITSPTTPSVDGTNQLVSTTIDHLHGNEMFLFNIVDLTSHVNHNSFVGQIDCETAPTGTWHSLDCVNKGDYLMFLNVPIDGPTDGAPPQRVAAQSIGTDVGSDSAFLTVNPNPTSYGGATNYHPAYLTSTTAQTSPINPKYPNIYRVMKISRDEIAPYTDPLSSGYLGPSADGFSEFIDPLKSQPKNPNDMTSEKYRHKIVLDQGVNSYFTFNGASPLTSTGSASVYKFHPPVYAGKEEGYGYVGPCSNRGVCDTSTGLCQCYPGYTSDNCGTQNALAL